ncbi:MAG: response regulator transcription factor [Gemmatimonadota bacterium]|nr:MAG: response regulator transcription factor [Gemmatimonadota bacterium]
MPDQPAAMPADGQPHVLVVDDDSVIRKLARALLETSGFMVSEAVDGAAALEHLEAGHRYDLMVLDVNMPRLGGDELLRLARDMPATTRLPVVMLTGSDSRETETELMRMGAADCIRKPIDPPRFVACIKAALRRAGGPPWPCSLSRSDPPIEG